MPDQSEFLRIQLPLEPSVFGTTEFIFSASLCEVIWLWPEATLGSSGELRLGFPSQLLPGTCYGSVATGRCERC